MTLLITGLYVLQVQRLRHIQLRTVFDVKLSAVGGSDVGLQRGLDESRLPLELSTSGSEQKYMEEMCVFKSTGAT